MQLCTSQCVLFCRSSTNDVAFAFFQFYSVLGTLIIHESIIDTNEILVRLCRNNDMKYELTNKETTVIMKSYLACTE